MTFAPTLEGGIGYNRPVESPNAINAIAGLFDTFAPKEKKAPSAESLKDEARRFYFQEWDAGQQLISQGKAAAGKARINSAYRGWASTYGPGTDEEVDKSFEMSTGSSVNTSQFGSATDYTAIRATPEFGMNVELVRATNPELDEAQIEQEAIRRSQTKMANDAKIAAYSQDQKVTWIDAERSYVEGSNLLLDDIQLMLATVNEDQVTTPEEAQQLRSWYNVQRSKFRAPPGVDQATWKAFETDRLGSIDAVVNAAIGSTTEGAMNNDLGRALNQIIEKAIVQGKLPPALRIQLTPNANGDFGQALSVLSGMSDAGGFGPEWQDSINTALSMDYEELLDWVTEFENKDASFLDKVDISEFTGLSSSKKVNSLAQDVTSLNTDDLGKASLGIVNIVEKVAGLEGTALTPTLLGQTFNSQFYQKLEEVYAANPVVGEALVQRANVALASQETAIVLATEATAKAYGWGLKKVNGTYDFYPDDKLMRPEVKADLDKYFGGDWKKAIAAKGMIDPSASGLYGPGMFTGAMVPSQVAFALGAIDKLRPNIAKFNSVMKTRDRLNAIVPPQEEVSGAAGQDEVQGSAGTDTLTGNGPIATKLGIDFAAKEQEYRLPSGYLERTAQLESSGNPNAQNPNSSAGGLFQQLDSNARAYGVSDKFDPAQSTEGAAKFAAENNSTLTGVLGRAPTGGELYLAHQQGPGGAAKLLSNPSALAVDIVGADAVRLNGGNDRMTAGEFANIWISKFNGARGPVSYTEATGQAVSPTAPGPQPRPEATTPVPLQSAGEGRTVALQQSGGVGVPSESVATQQAAPEASKAATQVPMDAEIQALIASLGDDESVQFFKSDAALEKAKASGRVSKGDTVVVNGKIVEVS